MDRNLKKLGVLAVAVFVALFVIGIIKDQIAKSAVTVSASTIAGAPVGIGGLSLGILTQSVAITDFEMYNPQGFPKDVLFDISRIDVKMDMLSLFKQKLHIPKAVFDLREMVIVKNKEGKLNVDELKFSKQEQKPQEKAGDKKKSSQEMSMQIDELFLNIGRVVVKDYSKGGEPSVLVYDVGLKNKSFKNLNSAQQMAVIVTIEAMKPTALKSAGVYAAAAVLGVGLMPAGIVGALVGKDYADAVYNASYEKVYNAYLDLFKKIGSIKKEGKDIYQLEAKAEGCDLKVKFEKIKDNQTKVIVAARQLVLPKPEVAAGIIYRLENTLK